MQFVEALKLRSKLFLLFILISLGLMSIGVLGAINLNAMKKNIDSLYFGSFIPITELNEIVQTYHGNLLTTMYKAKNLDMSQSQLVFKIENSLLKIEKSWNNYESHFKRDEELKYVDYVALEIEETNRYFFRILKAVKDGKTLQKLSIPLLEKYVQNIDSTVKKLINYEIEIAKYERKFFLNKYTFALKELIFVLVLIVFAVLLISYYVFKSIQNDQTKLERSTKKLKQLNKKLENASYTDSLTGAHNRRYFNLVYDREIKRAKRGKNYITFMMLDIDFFKQYNDTYGHIKGDYALKSVVKVLKEVLKRPSDYVFRLGGEEFGVLLVDTDELDSAKMAQKICDRIKKEKIKHENSKVNDYLTISIGVICCIADEALDENALITCADNMLYKAKENGRDRYEASVDAIYTIAA